MPTGTRSRAGMKDRIDKLTNELIRLRREKDCLLRQQEFYAAQMQRANDDKDFWFAQCKEEVRKRLELETAHVSELNANPFPPDMEQAERYYDKLPVGLPEQSKTVLRFPIGRDADHVFYLHGWKLVFVVAVIVALLVAISYIVGA